MDDLIDLEKFKNKKKKLFLLFLPNEAFPGSNNLLILFEII